MIDPLTAAGLAAAAACAGAALVWMVFAAPARARLKSQREAEDRFAKLAADALRENRAAAGGELETLVKPLGEGLAAFERRIGEIEKARERAYGAVTEQVGALAEGQRSLRSETARLVRALRRPETRGRWGEHQLRNVFEAAGMTAHVDFVEQPALEGGDGLLRPDAVVRLPGGKTIAIDAKTPLDAYLAPEDEEEEDDAAREARMKAHARQIRAHVQTLASKRYQDAMRDTPDFVVMFVPAEAFFAAAAERDPELFDRAVDSRVLVCTPMTLVALLKTVAHVWRQEAMAENARRTAELGRELHERIGVFVDHLRGMGAGLERAVEAYNKGVGSLEKRMLPAARKFEELEVAPPGKPLPALEGVDAAPREPRPPDAGSAGPP